MSGVITTLTVTLGKEWKRMLIAGVLFALLFQVLMLLALMVRFQAVPNYITFYDWFANIGHIVRSTPSWSDILAIVNEEWLIEIGKMNYDYGTGISEWSLNVLPSRLLVLMILGALTTLCLALTQQNSCSYGQANGLRAATGLGALLVTMTNVTMSWVVCCATPSWVVGLAILGLGVSTSLALETMGPLLNGLGFSTMGALIFFLAWRKSRANALPVRELKHA